MEFLFERWMRPVALATAVLAITAALPDEAKPVWGAPAGNTTSAPVALTGGLTAAGGAGATSTPGSAVGTTIGAAAGTTAGGPTSPYRLPPTVLTINGSPITREQVDSELERNNTWAKEVVFSLALARLLHQRATEIGLTPTPAQYDQAYTEANGRAQGLLEQVLARNHMTRSDFEQLMLRPQLEMTNLRNHDVAVSDAEIQQYYDQHRAEWGGPQQVELYRLHTSNKDAAGAAVAELNGGKGWSATFKKYSDDKPYYRTTDGLYGTVPEMALPPEVSHAIAGLKAGQLSQPMPINEEGAGHGFVVWKVNQFITPNAPTLAQKREEIRRVLVTTKARPELDVLRDLVRAAKIENVTPGYETMFAQILNPQPPPQPAVGLPGGVQSPAGGGPGLPPPPPVQH